MSVISDTFNKEIQSQSHGTNGSLIVKKEGEHSKVSDCSKDYKELTNEINKFLNGAEEVGNSKSNSGIGDAHVGEDINNCLSYQESQANHIENRINEMKKLNDMRLKTKKKQVKMIANSSKVSNELIEKCMILKNERGQTKKDNNYKFQEHSTNDIPTENINNPKLNSNQRSSRGMIPQEFIKEEDKKEKWISFPPKKMLYSTYSSSLPSMSITDNHNHLKESTFQPNYYQQPQTMYYLDNTQFLNNLNTQDRVPYHNYYTTSGKLPIQTYYSNNQQFQSVQSHITQNQNLENHFNKQCNSYTNSYASQLQPSISSNNEFNINIENVRSCI